ncbi:MAG: serine/threonine-protein phosphatase [Elusimicrobia bacterium]|nr:serine/threonine-protein phosphatase [Elusimicrobiota bacterium]
MSGLRGGLEVSFRALSDVGRVRSENQDAWFADQKAGIFLVADGMGGMTAGGVAAKAAAEVLPKLLAERLSGMKAPTEKAFADAAAESVADFSAALYARSMKDRRLEGTGTTVVLALIRGRCAYIANLGDSRAYLYKGGLRQVTEDHSLAAALQRLGKLTPEQAAVHPGRSTLTRYAGMKERAEADVRLIHLKGSCRLLLCSDGLTGMVPDERIASILALVKDPAEACRRLVDEANEAGGRDNVTALLADLRHP